MNKTCDYCQISLYNADAEQEVICELKCISFKKWDKVFRGSEVVNEETFELCVECYLEEQEKFKDCLE